MLAWDDRCSGGMRCQSVHLVEVITWWRWGSISFCPFWIKLKQCGSIELDFFVGAQALACCMDRVPGARARGVVLPYFLGLPLQQLFGPLVFLPYCISLPLRWALDYLLVVFALGFALYWSGFLLESSTCTVTGLICHSILSLTFLCIWVDLIAECSGLGYIPVASLDFYGVVFIRLEARWGCYVRRCWQSKECCKWIWWKCLPWFCEKCQTLFNYPCKEDALGN